MEGFQISTCFSNEMYKVPAEHLLMILSRLMVIRMHNVAEREQKNWSVCRHNQVLSSNNSKLAGEPISLCTMTHIYKMPVMMYKI